MEFIVGYNTYMTLDEADSIVENELDTETEEYNMWVTLDDCSKKRLIIKYTRRVDKLLFIGGKVEDSNLSWGRIVGSRRLECPYEIKVGIIKFGLTDRVNSTKQEYKMQELGVKSYSIKGASISFTDNIREEKTIYGIPIEIFEECFSKWVY